jgi:acyl dehydratase
VRAEFGIRSFADGRPVARQRTVIAVLGASNRVDIGISNPETSFDVPESTRHVTFNIDADLPIRYARSSGEDAPIHTSSGAAARLGFSSLVLQGSCTLALATDAVGRATLGVGLEALSAVAIRYRTAVLAPASLTVHYAAAEAPSTIGHTFTVSVDDTVAAEGLAAFRFA